jgi:tetratricopeptide (TPR) repeat protein
MRAEVRIWMGILGLGLALAMAPLVASAAQQQPPSQQQQQQQQPQQQQQQQQPGQQGQQGQPPAAPVGAVGEQPKVDPQEEAAYKAFYQLNPTDSDQVIKLGEDFVQKYPTSRYSESVYSRLTQAYFSKNQSDKMFAAGDKALALNPDDVDVLSLVGWVIPHSYDPNDMDAERKLDKAEQYTKHAIDLLNNMQKPTTMDQADFDKAKNAKLAQSYSGLGLVYFRRGDYAQSNTDLEKATQVDPSPDPTDYFVMGINYQQLKKYADAAQAFDKCGQTPGGLQARCKQGEDQAKKAAVAKP